MANILITEFMNQKQVEQLSALHNVNYEPELYSNNEAIIENSSDVHALIVRNKTKVDMQLINSMKNLKVIGRLGVGLDNIDVTHCKEKNVPVIIAEAANAGSVSEYVMMGLLTLFRGIQSSTEDVLKGEWDRNKHTGSEINGKTLGIVGVGTIGQIVAKNAKNMGMNVIGNDIEIGDDDPLWSNLNIQCCTFEELVHKSDAITIHVPLTNKTHNLLTEKEFEKMVSGS